MPLGLPGPPSTACAPSCQWFPGRWPSPLILCSVSFPSAPLHRNEVPASFPCWASVLLTSLPAGSFPSYSQSGGFFRVLPQRPSVLNLWVPYMAALLLQPCLAASSGRMCSSDTDSPRPALGIVINRGVLLNSLSMFTPECAMFSIRSSMCKHLWELGGDCHMPMEGRGQDHKNPAVVSQDCRCRRVWHTAAGHGQKPTSMLIQASCSGRQQMDL